MGRVGQVQTPKAEVRGGSPPAPWKANGFPEPLNAHIHLETESYTILPYSLLDHKRYWLGEQRKAGCLGDSRLFSRVIWIEYLVNRKSGWIDVPS